MVHGVGPFHNHHLSALDQVYPPYQRHLALGLKAKSQTLANFQLVGEPLCVSKPDYRVIMPYVNQLNSSQE